MLERGLEEKTYVLNLGPQHPSTHGVLRVELEMEGEFITKADPDIGYGHRGHEHMAENRTYPQYLPNMGRVDYLHALAYNQGYCMAVEKLIGLTVPERGEFIRVITAELNRITTPQCREITVYEIKFRKRHSVPARLETRPDAHGGSVEVSASHQDPASISTLRSSWAALSSTPLMYL